MVANDPYSCFSGGAFTHRPKWLRAFAPLGCVLMLALLLASLAPPARAGSNVTVGCPGGAPGTFPSITAALGAISGTNDTITVSGTCTEFVLVVGVRGLGIIGTAGAALVDPGSPDPFGLGFDGVLTIRDSQGVGVGGLTIQVASRSIDTQIPVVSVEGSTVTISGCKLEGAGASDGIDISGPSGVRVTLGTVIENNNDGQGNGEGISVDAGSSLSVDVPRGAPFSAPCPVIQGNGDNGIFVGGGGSVLVRRCATIQNNGSSGIAGPGSISIRQPQARLGAITIQNNGLVGIVTGGGSIGIQEPQATPGAILIQQNLIGVAAFNGGRLSIGGPALIQGNTSDGVALRAAAGTIFATDPGPAGPTIRGTGSGPFVCCAPLAGIRVQQGGRLELDAALVTGNFAPGLLVKDNSTVRIVGPCCGQTLRITNNPVGVAVTNLSTAELILGPVISGNTGPDLSCSPDSVAYGDASGVGRINCPGFRVEPQPGAPVPPGKPPL